MRNGLFSLSLFGFIGLGCKDEPGIDTDSDTDADSDSDTDTDSDADQADPDVDTFWPDGGYRPENPVRVIFMGDSITAGTGAETDALAYTELLESNDDDTWADYAEVDLAAQYPNLSEFVNVAVGGARTQDIVQDQIPDAESEVGTPMEGETIVVATIAGNDLATVIVYPAAKTAVVSQIEDNLNELVDWVQDPEVFPDGAWLYLANVYDPSDGVGEAEGCFTGFDTTEAFEALAEANANTRAMAEERGIAVVDMYGHFYGHGFNYDDTEWAAYDEADPTLWFISDCIHPNTRGHHELRRLFYSAIANEPLPYRVPDGSQ